MSQRDDDSGGRQDPEAGCGTERPACVWHRRAEGTGAGPAALGSVCWEVAGATSGMWWVLLAISWGRRFTTEMLPSWGPGKEQVTEVAARLAGVPVTDGGGAGGARIIRAVQGPSHRPLAERHPERCKSSVCILRVRAHTPPRSVARGLEAAPPGQRPPCAQALASTTTCHRRAGAPGGTATAAPGRASPSPGPTVKERTAGAGQ